MVAPLNAQGKAQEDSAISINRREWLTSSAAVASALLLPNESVAALPQSSASDSGAAIPSFFTTLRKHYPNALPASAAADKVAAVLRARGYASRNTLVGSSLCCAGSDVASNQLCSQLLSAFGGGNNDVDGNSNSRPPASITNLSGVAGIPFVGPGGFDAFFSYVPSKNQGGGEAQGGKVLIVFGPSVGIDEGGATATGSAAPCQAITKAFNMLREGVSSAKADFGLDALQEEYYIKELQLRLLTNKVDVTSVDTTDGAAVNNVLSKMTYATHDIISDRLLKEIDDVMQSKKATFWDDVSEVTILGGITISQVGGRGSFGEFFAPIVLQSMSKVAGRSFVEKDNLLDSLVEKPKPGPVERPGDRQASSGRSIDLTSPGNVKINVSDESLQKGGIAFAGAAVASGSVAAIGSSIRNRRSDAAPPTRVPVPSPARSATRSVSPQMSMEERPVGVPEITKWRQNDNDGSISGQIYGSPAYPDGSYITTSPITGDASDVRTGLVVRTASESQYYLGKRPEPSMPWSFVGDKGSGARAATYSVPPPTTKESYRATVSLPTQSPPRKAAQKEEQPLLSRLFSGTGKKRAPAPKVDPAAVSLIEILEEEIDGTDRGLFGFSSRKGKITSLIRDLEGLNPVSNPAESALNMGTWELIYSDTNFFLTSPFFLARQDACSAARGGKAFARYMTNLQSSSSLGSIGTVRQIITESGLISEINTISDSIDGAIVSTASIRPTLSGRAWDMSLSSLEVRGSNTFVVRQLMDIKNGSNLPGGNVLKRSRALLETTYLDGSTRVSRDAAGGAFVFCKISDGTSPTDFRYLDGADSGIRLI